MKIIKLISEKIQKQLDCAEGYARLAIEYKDIHPDAAKAFYDLSLTRMDGIKIKCQKTF